MPPNPPDRFAPIPDVYDIAAALGRLIDAWMDEYLAAIERQATDLEPGQTKRPPVARVRHAGIWRRGDGAPAVVVWPEGIVDEREDPGGQTFGTVQLGVLLIAAASNEDATTRIAQRYTAAARAILLQRPVVVTASDGTQAHHRLRPADASADFLAIDAAESGRIRAGITLSYLARNVYLGRRDGGPPPDAEPRPDPSGPWPPTPTFDRVFPPEVVPTRDPLG